VPRLKFFIVATIFLALLIFTSTIKNETRLIEKQISSLNTEILSKRKNLNQTQLDYYYLSSPAVIEKRLKQIGFNNYQTISYSKIFLDISDFNKIEKKISNLKNLNEKKIQKK
tara:strand:- start:1122 stop:1460 length:339 start_codon:yes stop_codon:yes gene_type:complete